MDTSCWPGPLVGICSTIRERFGQQRSSSRDGNFLAVHVIIIWLRFAWRADFCQIIESESSSPKIRVRMSDSRTQPSSSPCLLGLFSLSPLFHDFDVVQSMGREILCTVGYVYKNYALRSLGKLAPSPLQPDAIRGRIKFYSDQAHRVNNLVEAVSSTTRLYVHLQTRCVLLGLLPSLHVSLKVCTRKICVNVEMETTK